MDFSKLDLSAAATNGADMKVRHPINDSIILQDDGSPVTIRLRGHDSPEFRAFAGELARRANKAKGAMSLEDAEARTAELLYKLTISWSGISWEGEILQFSAENAKMLYGRLAWLREQIDAFVTDRANFSEAAKN